MLVETVRARYHAGIPVLLRQFRRDGGGNKPSVQTAVFDEYLVSMHAGNDYTRQIDSGPLAFQRSRIASWPKCNGVYA